jgi:hypothetical protein
MSEYLDDNLLNPNEYDHVFFENSRIYLYNSDDEKDEEVFSYKTAEDWIDENEEELTYIFDGLKNFPLCEHASYSDFCEFMLYVSNYNKSDISDWITHAAQFQFTFTNLKNPTLREFTAHHLYNILDMYMYIETNSNFNIGPVKHFIDYVYIYSDHHLK